MTELFARHPEMLHQEWKRVPRAELISITELAALLGVSLRTTRRLQAAGKLPGRVARCRQLLYKRAEIRAMFGVGGGD